MRRRPPFIVQVLGVVALVASTGLALYWAVQETGLYRLLAELQLKLFGAYETKITFLLTWFLLLFVLLLPSMILLYLSRLSEEQITIPDLVPSAEEEAKAIREQKTEQTLARLGTSFAKIRYLAVMWTFLILGSFFGILGFIQWILDRSIAGLPNIDWIGLLFSLVLFTVGLFMIRAYLREKRK